MSEGRWHAVLVLIALWFWTYATGWRPEPTSYLTGAALVAVMGVFEKWRGGCDDE